MPPAAGQLVCPAGAVCVQLERHVAYSGQTAVPGPHKVCLWCISALCRRQFAVRSAPLAAPPVPSWTAAKPGMPASIRLLLLGAALLAVLHAVSGAAGPASRERRPVADHRAHRWARSPP